MSFWGFRATPLFTSRFICMARLGITATGRFMSTMWTLGEKGVSPAAQTFPARESGRSIQVLKMGLP